MTTDSSTASLPTTDESQAFGQYRTVSMLSVLAFIGGIASSAALAHIVMWWLPIAVFLFAVIAYRQIDRQPRELTGKGLAVAAMVLSCLFLSWAVSRHFVGQNIERKQSQQLADAWLDLIRRDELYKVHQWFVSAYSRRPPGVDLAEAYTNDAELVQAFETFREETIEPLFSEVATEDTFRFRRVSLIQGPRANRTVDLVFEQVHNGESRLLEVTVERRFDPEFNLMLYRILGVRQIQMD